MVDDNNFQEDLAEFSGEEFAGAMASGKGKKGKGEAGSAGTIGAKEVQLSEAVLQSMQAFGVSMKQITEILKGWSHLAGEALNRAIGEFSRDIARASAHAMVQIGRNDNFTILLDFIEVLAGRGAVQATPQMTRAPTRG